MRLLLLIPFLVLNTVAQQRTYEFPPYKITFSENVMVVSKGDEGVWKSSFRNPSENEVDLDRDNLSEFIVTDKYHENGRILYTLFIFNTIDTFFLADSISSGTIEPYITYSEEIEDYLIIAGISSFMQFTGEGDYLPINCYKYETGEVLLINDEIYDVFLSENDALVENIDKYFESNVKNCNNTKNILSAISAAYANYINAGEPVLASHLISNYYYCDDKEAFISRINELIQN